MKLQFTSPFAPELIACKNGRKTCIDSIWGLVELSPPQMIVALSLTHSNAYRLADDAIKFPAIIDTGFNRTLEIDQRHLLHKSFDRRLGASLGFHHFLRGREYYWAQAHVWLHCIPYGSKLKAETPPILLVRTKTLSVMKPEKLKDTEQIDPTVWPPLPLLGLEALVENNLHLAVNEKTKFFSVYKHR